MTEAEQQALVQTVERLNEGTKELVRLGSALNRHALQLNDHQVDLDRHAQKLGGHAMAVQEALAAARASSDIARSTRDRVDLVLGVLELQGHSIAAVKKALRAQSGMLKRLLSGGRPAAKPKPRLKVVHGGRVAPPGPSPKRRG